MCVEKIYHVVYAKVIDVTAIYHQQSLEGQVSPLKTFLQHDHELQAVSLRFIERAVAA